MIFTDMDTALRDYPDLVRNTSARSSRRATTSSPRSTRPYGRGGSFVYVPEGVKVEIPLQAYFRINAQNMGQFERTLIIAEPGTYVHYVEGCTAPTYSHRLPAQRRGRDRRQGRRAGSLHHDPELVAQRLQPRDQARHGLYATPRWNGSTATWAAS